MSRPTVLIVEDTTFLFAQLQRFFQEKEFDVLMPPDQAVTSYKAAAALIDAGGAPDLAVLDIELDGVPGNQDGFRIGALLQARFDLPIIYLTNFDGDPHVAGAEDLSAQFLVKDAVLQGDFPQLWASVRREKKRIEYAQKRKEVGRKLPAKLVDVGTNKPLLTAHGYADEVARPMFVEWAEVVYIEACNAANWIGRNNELILHSSERPKGWCWRGSFADIQASLPPHMVRFNRSQIVNAEYAKPIPGKLYDYKVNGQTFCIKGKYREPAIRQLKALGVIK